MSSKRPVAVVTGFLGSGKTTLLSRLLREPGMDGTAVLVNEIGEVGLDHHLLERVDETTVLLENGCICCTRREELAQALRSLLERESRGETPPVRKVVVETSGLADPTPIPFTLLSDPVLRHHYEPGAFITKTDLVNNGEAAKLRQNLSNINPGARILQGLPGEAVSSDLLDRAGAVPEPVNSLTPEHTSDSGVSTVSLTLEEPLDWTAFGVWLSALLYARGEDILRVKGLVDTGEAGPTSINGVQHVIHPPEHLGSWPEGVRSSRLVFIVRGIEPDLLLSSLRAFQKLPQRIS